MRDFTIVDGVRLVRRWWWVFVLCPLLAAGVTFAISRELPKIYEADLTLVVIQPTSSSSSEYNNILAAERRTVTFSRLATTRPVLRETINRLNLDTTPEKLAKAVTVSPIGDTQLLSVTVADEDPATAAAIANTLADVFIQHLVDQQAGATGTTRDELRQNIASVKARIDETSARIDQLQSGPDANTAATLTELRQLQALLSQDQTTYGSLLEAQQRMDLIAAEAGNQIQVAEQAVAPLDPVRPRVKLNTALAGVLGLVIAAGLVLVAGYLDDTVKTAEDVERLAGRSALGMIPQLRSPQGLEAIAHPNSAATEAYRTMRTNFQFATMGQTVRSLVMTSFRPGDGKTTTIVNLAVVLAQGGQRVILVDADLRRPQVQRYFTGLATRTGLTNLLLANADVSIEPLLRKTTIPGLRILPAGPLPPNPPDVLNAPRAREVLAKLEEMADIVLFDAPPMAVSDALILGGITDGVLLVTQQGQTRSSELVRAVRELTQSGLHLLGVVVNRVTIERGSHYHAYYQSYYQSDPETFDGQPTSAPGARPKPLLPRRSGKQRQANQAVVQASGSLPDRVLTGFLLWCANRGGVFARLVGEHPPGKRGS